MSAHMITINIRIVTANKACINWYLLQITIFGEPGVDQPIS